MAEVASYSSSSHGGGNDNNNSNTQLEQLRRLTNNPHLDEATAHFFLEVGQGSVELAAVFYYEQQQHEQQQQQASQRNMADHMTTNQNGHCRSCGIRTHTTTRQRNNVWKPLMSVDVYDGICISCFPALVPTKARDKFFHRNVKTWQSAAGLTMTSLVGGGGVRAESAKKLRQCHGTTTSASTRLSLAGAGLPTLPNAIGCLDHVNLVSLDCSNNKLEALPVAIGSLVQLRELRCDHNRLKSLPDRIGKLINLQLLHVKHNQLVTLPESMASMTALQELDCTHNALQQLPKQLPKRSLQVLRLGHNQLQRLPDTITTLTQLQVLQCQDNKLSYLPRNLGALTKLRSLFCQTNQLVGFPATFQRLTLLQQLDCSKNPLDAGCLQSAIRGMQHLQKLKCFENDVYQGDNLQQWIAVGVGEGSSAIAVANATTTAAATPSSVSAATATAGAAAAAAAATPTSLAADVTTITSEDSSEPLVAQLEYDTDDQDDAVPTFRVSLEGLPSKAQLDGLDASQVSSDSLPPIPPPIPMPTDEKVSDDEADDEEEEVAKPRPVDGLSNPTESAAATTETVTESQTQDEKPPSTPLTRSRSPQPYGMSTIVDDGTSPTTTAAPANDEHEMEQPPTTDDSMPLPRRRARSPQPYGMAAEPTATEEATLSHHNNDVPTSSTDDDDQPTPQRRARSPQPYGMSPTTAEDEESDDDDDDEGPANVFDQSSASIPPIPPPEEMVVPDGCYTPPPPEEAQSRSPGDDEDVCVETVDGAEGSEAVEEDTSPAAGQLDLLASLSQLQELITTVVDTPKVDGDEWRDTKNDVDYYSSSASAESTQVSAGKPKTENCSDDNRPEPTHEANDAKVQGEDVPLEQADDDECNKENEPASSGVVSAQGLSAVENDTSFSKAKVDDGSGEPTTAAAAAAQFDFFDWASPPAPAATKETPYQQSEGHEADLLGLGVGETEHSKGEADLLGLEETLRPNDGGEAGEEDLLGLGVSSPPPPQASSIQEDTDTTVSSLDDVFGLFDDDGGAKNGPLHDDITADDEEEINSSKVLLVDTSGVVQETQQRDPDGDYGRSDSHPATPLFASRSSSPTNEAATMTTPRAANAGRGKDPPGSCN